MVDKRRLKYFMSGVMLLVVGVGLTRIMTGELHLKDVLLFAVLIAGTVKAFS